MEVNSQLNVLSSCALPRSAEHRDKACGDPTECMDRPWTTAGTAYSLVHCVTGLGPRPRRAQHAKSKV